jgi:multidrug resistance efflux pump
MRKFILPLLAVLSFGLAVLHVVRAQQELPDPPPPAEPARSPYNGTVAGAGLVEAKTENIAIGAHVPGVVQSVFVKVGQKVRKGEPLFQLDGRHLLAELKTRQANLLSARAKLKRTLEQPRLEELPAAEAKVQEADANLRNEKDQLDRILVLQTHRAASDEDVFKRRQMYEMARQQLARAQADLDLLKAGAWQPDRDIARADVAQAEAMLGQTQTEVERLTVNASVDGEVLQVNVRPGEFVGTPPNQPLIVLGDVHRLHLRADIDEHDIPRFSPDAPAVACVRGHAEKQFPLTVVRVEPFVVPKKSLTGGSTERVDTRVLQVIYAIDTGGDRLFVGQQMDVFVEATPTFATGSPGQIRP